MSPPVPTVPSRPAPSCHATSHFGAFLSRIVQYRTQGGTKFNTADAAIMSTEGSSVTLQAKEKDTAVLILSGEPINESIAARGPFVMNTQKELTEAMRDYQLGQNGFE